MDTGLDFWIEPYDYLDAGIYPDSLPSKKRSLDEFVAEPRPEPTPPSMNVDFKRARVLSERELDEARELISKLNALSRQDLDDIKIKIIEQIERPWLLKNGSKTYHAVFTFGGRTAEDTICKFELAGLDFKCEFRAAVGVNKPKNKNSIFLTIQDLYSADSTERFKSFRIMEAVDGTAGSRQKKHKPVVEGFAPENLTEHPVFAETLESFKNHIMPTVGNLVEQYLVNNDAFMDMIRQKVREEIRRAVNGEYFTTDTHTI